ncbi:ComEA family DNA-binding protein [Flavobacterium sp.]|jgi:DNA uptake protein ComE-like DNA-binding protein|uniref:ComEA family DNA-binding protein n=1 Tax=Flavobacterium sp. TaxID=239 RepID=UPI0037C04154
MKIKSYFQFTNEQRRGVLSLLLLIVIIQLSYFYWSSSKSTSPSNSNKSWLAMQSVIDSLKISQSSSEGKIYPFNPNFITDYKGYQLGMSLTEINKLFEFRKQNKYVNSALEFQQVTGVSDSLLLAISPYFKFPDWVNQPKKAFSSFDKNTYENKKSIIRKDINEATQDDLIKIYGIGPALSERILKQKDVLGGFVTMEQMESIWGLSPEVIENLNKYFQVTTIPTVNKIDINNLSVKELAKFPYFNYTIAKEIVTYRSMNNGIHSIEDLTKIKGMPNEKIKIIALYLEF